MSEVVSVETPEVLRLTVKDFLDLYLSLNPGHSLKAKAHLLTHYDLCMKNCGPVRNMACLRYEAKHKSLKAAATATTCRKSLPLTVAIKHQLNLSFRFKSNLSLFPQTECGPGHVVHFEEHEYFFLFP